MSHLDESAWLVPPAAERPVFDPSAFQRVAEFFA